MIRVGQAPPNVLIQSAVVALGPRARTLTLLLRTLQLQDIRTIVGLRGVGILIFGKTMADGTYSQHNSPTNVSIFRSILRFCNVSLLAVELGNVDKWVNNSFISHSSAPSPNGPWRYEDVAIYPWAHGPQVTHYCFDL